jgi:hypothetical protein
MEARKEIYDKTSKSSIYGMLFRTSELRLPATSQYNKK